MRACIRRSYPTPERWSREDARSAERLDLLQRLARERDAGASLHYPGYHAPRSLDELSEALLSSPMRCCSRAAPISAFGSRSSCAIYRGWYSSAMCRN